MTRYLTLAEFFFLAGEVTGLDVRTLTTASRVDLADSATRTSIRRCSTRQRS